MNSAFLSPPILFINKNIYYNVVLDLEIPGQIPFHFKIISLQL